MLQVVLPRRKKCGPTFLIIDNRVLQVVLPRRKKCGPTFLIADNKMLQVVLPQRKKCGPTFFMGIGFSLFFFDGLEKAQYFYHLQQ